MSKFIRKRSQIYLNEYVSIPWKGYILIDVISFITKRKQNPLKKDFQKVPLFTRYFTSVSCWDSSSPVCAVMHEEDEKFSLLFCCCGQLKANTANSKS